MVRSDREDAPYRRVAVFGGVYSNHYALRALLADVKRRDVDAVFCLGDLGAFGPNPDLCLPLLLEGGVRCIQGNYDNSIARGLDDCQCGYTDPRDNFFARLSYQYTFQKTSEPYRRWMGELPEQLRLRLGPHRVLLCHGSPRKMNEFLWQSTTPEQFLERLRQEHETDVILGTHSGIHWQRRLPHNGLYVNVGVIGRPENDGRTNVWYAILEAAPQVRVEFVQLEYDWRGLAKEMRQEQLPEEFVRTIETGWWTTCLEILPARERKAGQF
jgi:predicted phosphodiesterase